MIVEVIDDFLSTDDAYSVLDYCRMASYTYGETDTSSTPPTGMVHEICETDEIYELFSSKTDLIVGDDLVLNRMYINCFAPTENPYFHTDCDEVHRVKLLAAIDGICWLKARQLAVGKVFNDDPTSV